MRKSKHSKLFQFSVMTIITTLILSMGIIRVSAMHQPNSQYLHKDLAEEREVIKEISEVEQSVSSAKSGNLIKKLFDDVTQAVQNQTQSNQLADVILTAKGNLYLPVETSTLTWQYDGKRGYWHGGVDFAAPSGTEVRASHGGKITKHSCGNYNANSYAKGDPCDPSKVSDSSTANGYGYWVEVEGDYDGSKILTVYAHLKEPGLKKTGETVQPGDLLGYVGSTGSSTGPHLHFEVARPDLNNEMLKERFKDSPSTFDNILDSAWWAKYAHHYNRFPPGDYFSEFTQDTPTQTKITRSSAN